MFFLFSSVKAGKKRIVAIGFALTAMLLLALLLSCSTDDADDTNYPGVLPSALVGKWAFLLPQTGLPLETYTITESSLAYSYEDSEWPEYNYSFIVDICFVSNFNSSSGVIIAKQTFPSATPYTAIYYRNLSGSSVQLANVWDLLNNCSPDTASEEEAIALFTKGNMGKYVDWGYVQPQTKIAP